MTLGLASDLLPTVTCMSLSSSRASCLKTTAACSLPEGEKTCVDGCSAGKHETIAASGKLSHFIADSHYRDYCVLESPHILDGDDLGGEANSRRLTRPG